MRLLKPLLILISLAIPFTGFSQDRGIPVYSDYLTDNLYLLHPSMAGASLRNQVRLTARQQWFDVDDAPALQTLSANGRVSENIGVGGILYNDSNGRFSQQGAYATFAYHLMFSRDKVDLNQLSFGINAGILQEGLDESVLIGPSQPPDPQISGANLTDTYFNFDFGVSYYFRNFFAHATLKNLIPQQRDIFSEDFQLDNQRQYLGSLGYTFSTNDSKWLFEPSLLFIYKDQTTESSLDINFKAYRTMDFGRVWGGVSYRRSFDGAEYTGNGASVDNQKLQYITPFLGVDYGNFMFAYTYTYQANSIVLANSGFHQITLGYNFGEVDERYHCDCPAINNYGL